MWQSYYKETRTGRYRFSDKPTFKYRENNELHEGKNAIVLNIPRFAEGSFEFSFHSSRIIKQVDFRVLL